ncbi:MAG: hypothetical protein U0795_10105 [Pirellulales bacterium]
MQSVGWMFCAVLFSGIVATVDAQEEPASESPSLSSPGHAPAPTVRSLLEAFGYFIDDWRPFQDGEPVTVERRSDWGKFLQRLGRCDAHELSLLARKPTADGWFVGDWQGTAWELHGRVHQVRRVALERADAERFGTAELAVLEMTIDTAGTGRAVVVTSRIPASWRKESAEAWDEPVQVAGILMQRDAAGDPVFATQGVAWFPARPQPDRGVSANIVWLARHGVDVAAWQAIAPHGALAYQDRQPFYQMLAAVQSLGPKLVQAPAGEVVGGAPGDGRPTPRTDWDIARWLQEPAQQRGEFYELTGTARRAIAIEITDPAVRARHGLSRYYEVEVFVPLPKPLRLVPPRPPASDAIGSVPNEPPRPASTGSLSEARGEGAEEAGKSWSTYPVVFCCPELPAGFHTGENIHESVRLAGFYFKLWSYHAQATMSGERTDGSSMSGRQASPLLVGNSLAIVPPLEPGSGGLSTPLVLVLFGLLLVLLTLVPWWWARSDRVAAVRLRRWRQQRLTPDGGPAEGSGPAELSGDAGGQRGGAE